MSNNGRISLNGKQQTAVSRPGTSQGIRQDMMSDQSRSLISQGQPITTSISTTREEDVSKKIQYQIQYNQKLIQKEVVQSKRKSLYRQQLLAKKLEQHHQDNLEKQAKDFLLLSEPKEESEVQFEASNEQKGEGTPAIEEVSDDSNTKPKDLSFGLSKLQFQNTPAPSSIEQTEGIVTNGDSSALHRALDIISQHEEAEKTEIKKLLGMHKESLLIIDEKYNDFEEKKIASKNISFSESAIQAQDSMTLHQVQNDLDFQLGDETALLIDDIDDPYKNYDPKKFTAEQKKNWLLKQEEANEEFKTQFEQNKQRFRYEVQDAENSDSFAINETIDEEAQKLIEQGKYDGTYNIYGQRFHPYGNPYDYQNRGPQLVAGVYASTQGIQGVDHKPALPYERKYRFGANRYMPNVGQNQQRFVGYKNTEFDPLLNLDGSVINNRNGMNESRSSYFNQYQQKEKTKGNLDSTMTAIYSIVSNQVGLTFLLAPIGIKQLGLLNFIAGITISLLLNYFSVWLMNKSEKRYTTDYVSIQSMFDLSWNCYGNSVLAFQEGVRVLYLSAMLVALNVYLGTESEEILCKTMGNSACGKYDHLIRIAYNILSLPLIFSCELKGQKMIKYFGAMTFMIATGFLVFYDMQIYKAQSKDQQDKNDTQLIKNVWNPQAYKEFSTYYKIAGFVSLMMCLFESNQTILKVKSEMKNPKDFIRSFQIATMISLLMLISFSVMSYRAFGSEMVSPLTMNQGTGSSLFQTQVFLVAKVFFIFMVFSNYLIKQSEIFLSFWRLKESTIGSADDSIDQSLPGDFQMMFNALKIFFLTLIVFLSMKVPQNPTTILTIAGGLLMIILNLLFPMVIFNKTMSHLDQYPKTRAFNWFAMMSVTAIGGLGVYSGIMDFNQALVLNSKI